MYIEKVPNRNSPPAVLQPESGSDSVVVVSHLAYLD